MCIASNFDVYAQEVEQFYYAVLAPTFAKQIYIVVFQAAESSPP